MSTTPPPGLAGLCCLGLVTGLLSGAFGVGGGVVVVPALVSLMRFDQRRAAGTSVAAILPTALVGSASYALQGHLHLGIALALAVGSVVGAQLGSFLLSRLPTRLLAWAFIAFLLVIAVSLWLVLPERDSHLDLTRLTVIMLVITGIAAGTLSGLLGVGGGIVVVPILTLLFFTSDLTAKGASLFMMIPGAISGTVANSVRKNVDLRAAIAIGISASLASPLGTVAAVTLTPLWANVALSALLVAMAAQMSWRQLHR